MKIHDRRTGYNPPGEWANGDDYGVLDDCPECGAGVGQQCVTEDEDGSPVEIGAYVHRARTGEDP